MAAIWARDWEEQLLDGQTGLDCTRIGLFSRSTGTKPPIPPPNDKSSQCTEGPAQRPPLQPHISRSWAAFASIISRSAFTSSSARRIGTLPPSPGASPTNPRHLSAQLTWIMSNGRGAGVTHRSTSPSGRSGAGPPATAGRGRRRSSGRGGPRRPGGARAPRRRGRRWAAR